jgi:hypothetical protein
MTVERDASKVYGLLLGLSSLFALATIGTMIPWPAASWENILGYRSLCTFAPIATAICAMLAGSTCVVRSRLFGPRRDQKRSWAAPIAVGLALALVVGFSIPPYAKAKVDARSGASVASNR